MQVKEKYTIKIYDELKTTLKKQNILNLPRLEKISVSVGIGKIRDKKDMIAKTIDNLTKITGQKPVVTKSKKSISGFKLREGEKVGLKVTLRGKRMFDFYDRLINTALPQIRDFSGIAVSSIDKSGNVSIGIKEHVIFPEISYDEIDSSHGIGVTITIKADSKEEAIQYYKISGFPLERK